MKNESAVEIAIARPHPASGTRNRSHGEDAIATKTRSKTKPSNPVVAGP